LDLIINDISNMRGSDPIPAPIPPVKRWWRRMWKKHFELILTLIIALGFSLIVIPRIMQ
jgi:hypothetical protein